MRLQMYKGQEYSAVISKNISDHEDFTYRVYQKALTALDDIVRRTHRLDIDEKNDLRWNVLYGYSQNMVIFSGARGQGKTSAMLSFSETLRDRKRLEEAAQKEALRHLESCGFLVMDPIDPTVLERGQNLLALVLSKMLAYSEQQWKCHSTDYCGRFHDRTAERNDLLRLFQDCLNGINVVKSDCGDGTIKSLADVHKICDSSVLKQNFYKLAKNLLDQAFYNDVSVRNKFLVLQFDDTDFQIARGYEVMEDIRKYLTVPNIVILMATDTELLRKVLTQHYASEFEVSLNREYITPSLLSGISAKYLAKLVPPTYTAYMPHLDEEIRDHREQIMLQYFDDSGTKVDLVCPEPGADQETLSKYSFQDIVLRYIYKKTHLIFASHSAYMNNIIPTTLRGLAQLLGLLEFMEDVPELSAEDMSAPETLISKLKEQLPVIRGNLERFETYFTNDWIQAKLNVKQIDIIQKLSGQVPGQRVQYAASALRAYYLANGTIASAQNTDYSGLERLIDRLRKKHRQPEDYYFFFAINTLLTIENNKTILKIKENTCAQWTQGPVVFHYLQEESSLPRDFFLPNTGYSLSFSNNRMLVKEIGEIPQDVPLSSSLGESHFSYWIRSSTFSFLGLLTSALNPVPAYHEGQDIKVETKFLYRLQELACAVAANADVREQIRKCFDNHLILRPEGISVPDAGEDGPLPGKGYVDVVNYAYRNVIFPVIAAINTPEGCKAMNECFIGYDDIGITNILRSWIPDIQKALTYIDTGKWPEDDPSQAAAGKRENQELASVLAAYYQLAMEYIGSTNRSKSNFLTSAQQLFKSVPIEKLTSLTDLSTYLVRALQEGRAPQNVKTAHNRKLRDFCSKNGIGFALIKKAHRS